MKQELDPIIRSFARIYPKRRDITLTEALTIIMEEIVEGKIEITDKMIEDAKVVLDK